MYGILARFGGLSLCPTLGANQHYSNSSSLSRAAYCNALRITGSVLAPIVIRKYVLCYLFCYSRESKLDKRGKHGTLHNKYSRGLVVP